MSKFDMSGAGYMEALAWLAEESKLHLIDTEQSSDGFTVIALANSLIKDLDDE